MNRLNFQPINDERAFSEAMQFANEEAAKARRADDDELNAGIAEDLAAAVHEDLADEVPADTTAITGDKVALERVLEKRRAHKRELQKLLSVTKAKLRQADATIKGIEDHLDTLFECEA